MIERGAKMVDDTSGQSRAEFLWVLAKRRAFLEKAMPRSVRCRHEVVAPAKTRAKVFASLGLLGTREPNHSEPFTM